MFLRSKSEHFFAIAEEIGTRNSDKIVKSVKASRSVASKVASKSVAKSVQSSVESRKTVTRNPRGSLDLSSVSQNSSSRRGAMRATSSSLNGKSIKPEAKITSPIARKTSASKAVSKAKSTVALDTRKRQKVARNSKNTQQTSVAKNTQSIKSAKNSYAGLEHLENDETDFDAELLSDADLAECEDDSAYGASFDSDKIDDDDFDANISIAALAKNTRGKNTSKGRQKTLKTDTIGRKKTSTVPEHEASLQEQDISFDYKKGDHVVYCSHGVGEITEIKNEKVNDATLKLMVISFRQDRMTLKVPCNSYSSSKIRVLSSPKVIAAARKKLQSKSQVLRTLWSRRAQEYSNKIRSGDLCSIAEVVRDLYRQTTRATQSFSERQLYRQAKERLAREIAIVEDCDENEVMESIELMMQPGFRPGVSSSVASRIVSVGNGVE